MSGSFFRIENTERIEVKAVLFTCSAILMRLSISLRSACGVRRKAPQAHRERIDFKLHFLNAQRLPEAGGHEDHFMSTIVTREAERARSRTDRTDEQASRAVDARGGTRTEVQTRRRGAS